jgi:hypothetical protein
VDAPGDNDEVVLEYWPPVSLPRRKWRFLAIWRPIRAVWRRLPRLGKISSTTLVIGSVALSVGPIVALNFVDAAKSGADPESTVRFSVVIDGRTAGPPYAPPASVHVLPAVAMVPHPQASGVYVEGHLQLALLTVAAGHWQASATFTPSGPDLSLTTHGDSASSIPAGGTVSVLATINGTIVENDTCTATGGAGEARAAGGRPATLGSVGLVPGPPSTLTVSMKVSPPSALSASFEVDQRRPTTHSPRRPTS